MSVSARLRVLLAALLILGAAATPAVADDLDDQLDQVARQIADLEAQLGDTASQRSSLADEILSTQTRITELRAQLDAARSAADEATRNLNFERLELERVQQELRDSYLALAATRAELDSGREDARAVVRRLYMRSGHEIPEVTFSASSVADVALAVAYLDRVNQLTNAAVTQLEALEVQEERQQARIERQEAEVEDQVELLAFFEVRAQEQEGLAASRKEAVERELDRQRSLLAQLDREISNFEGELVGLEKEQERIEALIAAEQQEGGESPAGFVRPVPGPITSAFGPRLHPILGYTRMHTGVDMTAPYGQAIKAVADGRVILAGSKGGYGTTVIIDHGGGMATLYAHQSSLEIGYGELVEQGQVIGYAGSTGLATGPHLHFEVRIGGTPVDPAPYLEGT